MTGKGMIGLKLLARVSFIRSRGVTSTAAAMLSVDRNSIKYHGPLRANKTGANLLQNPIWNKDLAFSENERDRLCVRGLVPAGLQTIDDQAAKSLREIEAEADDIHKHLYLRDLQDRNETLFHRILIDNIERMAPIIYAPTVASVSQQCGFRFHRTRGMYFNYLDRGQLNTIVYNWPQDDVHLIVVTDGSRILGLGDLGVHGMAIPISKLALYCAAGGIAPHRVLPVTIDVGTNNERLLNDPDYIGLRQPRVQGDDYFRFVDEFMEAVNNRWPGVTVQFEDFEATKALPLLSRYRYAYSCYNDDIQGTGTVVLGALYAALRRCGEQSSITTQRYLCAGAGVGGLGISSHILSALEAEGLSRDEAMSNFIVCTSKGVIGKPDGCYGNPHHKAGISKERRQWQHPHISDGTPMEEAVRIFKPTVLLGLTGKRGTFTESMVKTAASYCETPIILPLSSPACHSECSAADAVSWTNGKAIVASGADFPDVNLSDGTRRHSSQCNNMMIFPGLGLATSIGGIKEFKDSLFVAAAKACGSCVEDEDLGLGACFPPLRNIRQVSHRVACAVLRQAAQENALTRLPSDLLKKHGSVEDFVDRKMYFPYYVPLL